MSALTLVTWRMRYSSRSRWATLASKTCQANCARLVQDLAAVLGVGVVAEVGALVEEALAVGVEQDAERVGVLLEAVADGQVAELRRVALPLHRVAAGPLAGRHGADVQRHAQAVAGVEARAAHLGQVPAGAEVAGAPLGVGLEAAGGQHHRVGGQVAGDAVLLDAHAADAGVVGDQ